MNNLDKNYLALCQDILENGTKKKTRTGIDSISVFGREIRHKMSDGFPLLTTRKMYFKGIATELIWFLRGDTNIKYLVDNGCHIWDGDAYKNYCKNCIDNDFKIDDDGKMRLMTKDEFILQFKRNDRVFINKWGELGRIYGHGWRKWNGKYDDELYEDYLKKVKDK